MIDASLYRRQQQQRLMPKQLMSSGTVEGSILFPLMWRPWQLWLPSSSCQGLHIKGNKIEPSTVPASDPGIGTSVLDNDAVEERHATLSLAGMAWPSAAAINLQITGLPHGIAQHAAAT